MPSLPRRAVIAITSATAPLHNGEPTGLFISEALHPYNVFKAAGFEVDLVSEKGTYVADWLSLQESFLNGEDKKQWEDVNGEFRKKVDNMPDVKSVNGKNVRVYQLSLSLSLSPLLHPLSSKESLSLHLELTSVLGI